MQVMSVIGFYYFFIITVFVIDNVPNWDVNYWFWKSDF